MHKFIAGRYDVAVIGAGHAGCEAALACARRGLKTIIFTINMDAIANLSCNPNIGGTAKGHLVREVDALGGEMAKNADKSTIHSRLLNLSKGPAVHSIRAQIDKRMYQANMKYTLEHQENLLVKQAEIVDIGVNNGAVDSVVTSLGAVYHCKACIIATGTFLGGRTIIGELSVDSGPDGLFPSVKLGDALLGLGVRLQRFKTGTPPRIDKKSIDVSKMEIQLGDERITPCSFETDYPLVNKEVCYLTYTNKRTHEIILGNLDRAPMYSGQIEGTGARYCPSIEDKVVRFSDKERHQIFIEPMGLDTTEMYVQGLSTSLPEDIQMDILHTIPGLEDAQIRRAGYAIEYLCCDAQDLLPTLEVKHISGLYGAGQFNGSSGYEEAAAQGLMAGINAYLKIFGEPPLILNRDEAYIGVLIDDLVIRGTNEPYRMMTSRAEYRLLLRQDNADLRLTEYGRRVGLISEERYQAFLKKKANISEEILRLKATSIAPNQLINDRLCALGTSPLATGTNLYELLKRPQISYLRLCELGGVEPLDDGWEQVEISVKYEGYIQKQLMMARRNLRLENKVLPSDIDYSQIRGLCIEAKQKLGKIRPLNLGQAMRITGVSPADIDVLLIHLRKTKVDL